MTSNVRMLTVEDRKNYLKQKELLKKTNINKLSEKSKLDIVRLLEKKENLFSRSILTWEKYFGELSEFPVNLYRKQRIFFECGKHFKVRALSGGNRSSKSFSATSEVAFHATGFYPSWWNGARLNKKKNITVLCVSDDWKTSREVIQSYLLREEEGADNGTGFIPSHLIDWEKSKKVSKDTYDYIVVNRIDGGTCKIVFRSSKSGRKLFQGFKCDFVLFDEEPPLDVYSEALMRTTTTSGLLVIAYTPLSGLTQFIKEFVDFEYDKIFQYDDTVYKQDNIIFLDKYKERKNRSSKIYLRIEWDDIPHLTEQQKRETLDGIPEWQWDARTKGIPVIGSGAIYPLNEKSFVVEHFDIPDYWYKWYGLDVGTTCTALSLLAQDPKTKIVYVIKEMSFYQNNGVMDYAQDIYKEVTSYIWGSIDHAANMGSQFDKKSIRKALSDTGLTLCNANKSVMAGLTQVYKELKQGRLKIFDTCINHLKEMRTYRRDDKGVIVKKDDHHMDSLRYAVMIPDDKRNGVSTLTSIYKDIDDIEDLENLLELAN